MSRHNEGKLYIGGLPEDATSQEIEDAFHRYGRIRKVWVARRPPGFAFVEFEDIRDAEDACRALDGQRICGVRAKVEMSHGGRRGGPPGGGGGGRGGRDDRGGFGGGGDRFGGGGGRDRDMDRGGRGGGRDERNGGGGRGGRHSRSRSRSPYQRGGGGRSRSRSPRGSPRYGDGGDRGRSRS